MNAKQEKAAPGGGKKGKGDGEDDSADTKRDKKLQAILLADAFTKTFRPVTLYKPKVMLPLVNVPMLDYTIEFLAQNGVEEILVFCVWHASMLEDYIIKSKWPSTISVRCIHSTSCESVGDALREIDKLGIINSDPFVLITGDVISNMDLKKAIAAHKERRKGDNDAIMTVVLKKVQKTAGINPILQDLVVLFVMLSNMNNMLTLTNGFL
jgi:translation initiation factor eIF-2B subunit epsilon